MPVIPGYAKYTIDKTGLIRSKRGRIKPAIGFADHLVVTLYNNNKKRKKLFLYLIMAEVFKGYRPGTGDTVVFLDGNNHNVHADNLEVGSRHELAMQRRNSDLPPGIVRLGDRFMLHLWIDGKKQKFGPYGSLRRALHNKDKYEKRFNL